MLVHSHHHQPRSMTKAKLECPFCQKVTSLSTVLKPVTADHTCSSGVVSLPVSPKNGSSSDQKPQWLPVWLFSSVDTLFQTWLAHSSTEKTPFNSNTETVKSLAGKTTKSPSSNPKSTVLND